MLNAAANAALTAFAAAYACSGAGSRTDVALFIPCGPYQTRRVRWTADGELEVAHVSSGGYDDFVVQVRPAVVTDEIVWTVTAIQSYPGAGLTRVCVFDAQGSLVSKRAAALRDAELFLNREWKAAQRQQGALQEARRIVKSGKARAAFGGIPDAILPALRAIIDGRATPVTA